MEVYYLEIYIVKDNGGNFYKGENKFSVFLVYIKV